MALSDSLNKQRRSADSFWRKPIIRGVLIWFLIIAALFMLEGYSDLEQHAVGKAREVSDQAAAAKASEQDAYHLRDLVGYDGTYITAYYPELFVIRLDDRYLHLDHETYHALRVVAERNGRREVNCAAALRYLEDLERVKLSGK